LNRDFRIPAPFCRKLTNMSTQKNTFEEQVAQFQRASDEKWEKRMAELQRQLRNDSPVNVATVIAAGTLTNTPPVVPCPPSDVRRLKRHTKRHTRHNHKPTFAGKRRLKRRVRPKPVTKPTMKRPSAEQLHSFKVLRCHFWNLDALYLFLSLFKLDKQLSPHVRRCGRTVPPSSRGGHWLLPQSMLLACLQALWVVTQVVLRAPSSMVFTP
jgi:hypothetical protein